MMDDKNPICVSLLLTCMLFLSASFAANKNPYLLTEDTWKALSRINKLLDTGQPEIAIEKLTKLLPQVQDKPYDESVVQQTLGYAWSTLGDHEAAIDAFRSALNLNALPPDVTHDLEFNLAQLLIFTGKYKEGIKYLEHWIESEQSPSLEAFILAATAYYEMRQYDKAIPYAKNVLTLKDKYDETWYQLLLACYLKTNQYQQAALLLEDMIQIQPDNPSYWQQLLAVWQHANNDKKTLATYELMLARGMLSNDDIKQLINMYLYLDLPYKAAKLLESKIADGEFPKESRNYELLGNAWLQAKELEKSAMAFVQAAKLSSDGNLYWRAGQIYFEMENYPQAILYLRKALAKGKLKHHAQAELLLGIALFHQKDYPHAQKAFEFALHNNSTRDQAEWWLQRIKDLDEKHSS